MIAFEVETTRHVVSPRGMKVGELARRTGLSVRTLHYYERLQRIKSLRQLGFSLDQIRACLTTNLDREFTGGNPSIERKVRATFIAEPERMARAGLDTEILASVNRAIRAL